MASSVGCDSPAGGGARPVTLVCDLDGTLLPKPWSDEHGEVHHPPLSEGPAHAPLTDLLAQGAILIGVTGSSLATHRLRFWDHLPLSARKAGRCLLAPESGGQLFRGSPADGSLVEDDEFARTGFNGGPRRMLTDDAVADLVVIGQRGLRAFFADLVADPGLVDDESLAWLRPLAAAAAEAEMPVTRDVHVVPRVEVREGNAAVVFVGVPVNALAKKAYFELPSDPAAGVEGKATGRCCFDCTPVGQGKSVVVEYLARRGEVIAGRSIALGDNPMGNDEGLTRWHADAPSVPSSLAGQGLPFVSVAESVSKVPAALRSCHMGGNDDGASFFLRALADSVAKEPCRPLDREACEELVAVAAARLQSPSCG